MMRRRGWRSRISMISRGFNRAMFNPIGGNLKRHQLSVITWNCRSLLCVDRHKRRKRLNLLRRASSDADVIFLQEVHGDVVLFENALGNILKRFWFTAAFHPNFDTGSVVTLVSRRLAPDSLSIRFAARSPGRILRTTIEGDNGWLILWNIHNFDIPRDVLATCCTEMTDDAAATQLSPDTHMTFVGGDFNFLPPGDTYKLLDDVASADVLVRPPVRPGESILAPLLANNFTELAQRFHTRYSSSRNSVAKLDRVYTACPQWRLLLLSCRGETIGHPRALHLESISDHAPVRIVLAAKRALAPSQRPIARHVAEHSRFREKCNVLMGIARLDDLEAEDRLLLHKEILKQCGRETRDELQVLDPHSPFVRCSMLESIARAVWFDDAKLAQAILDNNPSAGEYFTLVDGVPTILYQPRFSEAINKAKLDRLDLDRRKLEHRDDDDLRNLDKNRSRRRTKPKIKLAQVGTTGMIGLRSRRRIGLRSRRRHCYK